MSTAIKVENLSKAYQLGEIGTGTISRDLERYWAKLRGKEDPFLKISETNDRTTKGNSDIVWSLKDLNFEIQQGDAIGIIGRNGAGKSTLLKVLSRVTSPTTGSAKVKGRIASLLEVGTGFHPELSGRENIFLNGAILGMRKKEIQHKFDEIVDFAGVDRYIDTPVKRYSSGMYVRLAFAVAAHLESEILIVDEVLAVGDTEFQKKCLGKMSDVSKGEGRTVLFVSHNMGAIKNLCTSAILLHNGSVNFSGSVSEAIASYNDNLSNTHTFTGIDENKKCQIKSVRYYFDENYQNSILFDISIICNSEIKEKVSLDFRLRTKDHEYVGFGSIGVFDKVEPLKLELGENRFFIVMPTDRFALGDYILSFDVAIPYTEYLDRANDCLVFEISEVNRTWRGGLSQPLGFGSYHFPLSLLQSTSAI